MRVIAGQFKGKKLLLPPQSVTRPTLDRVKEAVFSILTSRLKKFDDLCVYDLFAGSGALGIEALSRGANLCVFSENNPNTKKILMKNLASMVDKAVVTSSYMTLDDTFAKPDLVFLDPPYDSRLEYKAIEELIAKKLLKPETLLVIEKRKTTPIDIAFEKYCIIKRAFGACEIVILKIPND